jgi:uncharacterized protein
MSAVSEYIYIARQTRSDMLSGGLTPHEEQVMSEHLGYLRDLADQGVVILFGRTQTSDEDTFGLVILRADSEGSAREIMENDPAIKEEVLSAKLYPYRIAGRAKD